MEVKKNFENINKNNTNLEIEKNNEEEVKKLEEREQAEYIKKIYNKEGKRYIKFAKIVLIFNFFTYILGYCLWKEFDFGVIFEIIAFILLLQVQKFLEKQIPEKPKKFTVMAMFSIGWLIVYDILISIAHLPEIINTVLTYFLSGDFIFYILVLDLVDFTLILIIVFLIIAYRRFAKAEGSKEYNTSIDWFYDKK